MTVSGKVYGVSTNKMHDFKVESESQMRKSSQYICGADAAGNGTINTTKDIRKTSQESAVSVKATEPASTQMRKVRTGCAHGQDLGRAGETAWDIARPSHPESSQRKVEGDGEGESERLRETNMKASLLMGSLH
ncbi:hypothetical protein B0H17DRAFT_1149491 [Mycena rosella]|uniref:Uncharacterized protein n=1 Tax=Mycena rosella TaxID=1033263 RepID=A0AAD7C2N0_MYCRO|nr:hypothetical protein B0H17DRAFT_1149491 [Mycena rosella]